MEPGPNQPPHGSPEGDGSDNPYQRLGIDRTADERAIKKAYFALVRRFPPETHPQQFQRLRAAYELLSDPAARERFDEAQKGFSEYPPALAERLAAAEEAQRKDNEPLARTIYQELLAHDPELSVARERLALSLFGSHSYPEALAEFDRLAAREPDNARHQFHRGLALGRQERHEEAAQALRRALALEPRNLTHRVVLVDCLIDAGHIGEALEVVADGDRQLPPAAPGRVSLALRRLKALVADPQRGDERQRALRDLDNVVRDLADADLPPYLASQLAGIAARLYADDRPTQADEVLAAAARLHPAARVERPLPWRRRARFRALPEAARAWLLAQQTGSDGGAVREMVWPLTFLALAGSAALSVEAARLVAQPRAWSALTWVLGLALLAVPLSALVLALQRGLRLLGSPLRGLVALHPLYLVRVRAWQVELLSLFHLLQARGTHHHTNGVYTGTRIDLQFAGGSTQVQVRGKRAAEAWLEQLSVRRSRALNLLAGGLLEAEHGVEGFTAAELEAADAPATPRGWLGRLGGAGRLAAATLPLALLLLSLLAHQSSEAFAEGSLASGGGGSAALVAYLHQHPHGRSAAAAASTLDSTFDRTLASYRLQARAGAPGMAGFERALASLRAARQVEVPVVVQLDGSDAVEAAVARSVVDTLRRLAGGAGLDEAVVFVGATRAQAAAAPVRVEATLDGRAGPTLVGGRLRLPTRLLQARIAILSADGSPLVAPAAVEVAPPRFIDVQVAPGGEQRVEAALSQRLLAVAGGRTAAALARAVGLDGIDPEVAAEALAADSSAAVRR